MGEYQRISANVGGQIAATLYGGRWRILAEVSGIRGFALLYEATSEAKYMGLIFLVVIGAVIIALAWGAAAVLTRAASNIYDRVNPNAHDHDALKADPDPDEPEGY